MGWRSWTSRAQVMTSMLVTWPWAGSLTFSRLILICKIRTIMVPPPNTTVRTEKKEHTQSCQRDTWQGCCLRGGDGTWGWDQKMGRVVSWMLLKSSYLSARLPSRAQAREASRLCAGQCPPSKAPCSPVLLMSTFFLQAEGKSNLSFPVA